MSESTTTPTRPTTPDLPHVETEAYRDYCRLMDQLTAVIGDNELVHRLDEVVAPAWPTLRTR